MVLVALRYDVMGVARDGEDTSEPVFLLAPRGILGAISNLFEGLLLRKGNLASGMDSSICEYFVEIVPEA